jgi:purine-binding chemotaxis protein CheW
MRQVLTFVAGGAEYGMPIEVVREIAEARLIASVPGAPSWMRGVMNLRGSVVPVVDLGIKLGLGHTSETRRTCLVSVELELDGEITPMAVMVDAVRRVIDLEGEIQPPPSFGGGVAVDFIHGTTSIGGQLIILIDILRILGSPSTMGMHRSEVGDVA